MLALIFVFLFGLFTPAHADAPPPLQIQVLEDPSHELNYSQAWKSELWKPFRGPSVLGYKKSRFWFQFRVTPPFEAGSSAVVLKIPYTYIGRATLYELQDNRLISEKTAGMQVPLSQNSDEGLVTGAILFPLDTKDFSQTQYLLSIEGDFPLAIPMEVTFRSAVLKEQSFRQLFLGLFFGILALAFLFNGFLGLWLKSGLYLIYSLFALSAFFLFLGHERLSVQLLWPNSPWWAQLEMHISGGFAVLFYALFVRKFLRTRVNTPKLDWALLLLVAVSSIRSVWMIFQFNQPVAMIGESAIVLMNILILVMTGICLRQGNRTARYFFISSFIYNLGSVLFILDATGLLYLPDWIEFAPHVGIVSEVIFLSLALADRIRMNNFQLERTIEKLDSEIQRRELTEAKLHQQQIEIAQTEKMSALGRMAAGIAHEINNPLAIISSYAEHLQSLCLRSPLPLERIAEIGPKIELTVQRISRIIKSMRTLARDSSSDPLTKTSVAGLMQDIQILCLERFRHNGIELKIAAVDPEIYINCRGPEISQVLVNILNNAYDAVQGQTEKIIEIDCKTNSAKEVLISVCNNGPPIPIDLQRKIYEPFFTTKQIGQGTGLGLSISKTLIENHGGRLWVESRSKQTCFILSLPRWAEEEILVEGPFLH